MGSQCTARSSARSTQAAASSPPWAPATSVCPGAYPTPVPPKAALTEGTADWEGVRSWQATVYRCGSDQRLTALQVYRDDNVRAALLPERRSLTHAPVCLCVCVGGGAGRRRRSFIRACGWPHPRGQQAATADAAARGWRLPGSLA
jgi:hypothetical protein